MNTCGHTSYRRRHYELLYDICEDKKKNQYGGVYSHSSSPHLLIHIVSSSCVLFTLAGTLF